MKRTAAPPRPIPFTLMLPTAIPAAQTNASRPKAWAMGLVWGSSKSQSNMIRILVLGTWYSVLGTWYSVRGDET
jgi:hypothetical protein